jgi:hypothetical protein
VCQRTNERNSKDGEGVMKKYIFALMLLLMSIGVSYSAVPSKIVGLMSECDTTLSGCQHIPVSFSVLCNQFVVGVSCPKTFHPSWVSGTRLWGSNLVDGCVTSVDAGVNWAPCTTQPFAGTAVQIASSTNGNVIAVSTVAGVCTIELSINNGASWTSQFTDANTCLPPASASLLVRCQQTGGQCDYVFVQSGTRTRTYRSTDNGVSWVQTNVASGLITTATGMVFDGTKGIAGGVINAGQVATVALGGAWNIGGVGWPAAANNYGTSTPSNWDSLGASVEFAFDGGVTFQYKQLSVDGVVLKSFVPTNSQIVGFPTIDCFQYNSLIDYCVGLNTTGGQSFWISTDDLASTIQLGSNAALGGLGTIYSLGGAIYISVAGTTGAFYKIS